MTDVAATASVCILCRRGFAAHAARGAAWAGENVMQ